MKRVYKYELSPLHDTITITIPFGARVLSVQMQRSIPVLWALVEEANTLQARTFFLRGTGHGFTGNEGLFVGTFQSGPFVWHLFEASR